MACRQAGNSLHPKFFSCLQHIKIFSFRAWVFKNAKQFAFLKYPSIPTTYHKRIGQSKFHPIKDTVFYLNTVIRMVMYFRPLRIFMPAAALSFIIGCVKSILSIGLTGTLQESDIIIFTLTVFLASIGLLADLMVSYYNRAV